MRTVVHPGVVRESRMDVTACHGRNIKVTLPANFSLEEAVAQALAPLNIDSAWLEIASAEVSRLDYVIPAESPDDQHVAWYSQTRGFAEGQIDRLGMIVGTSDGESFLHGHGLWTPANAKQAGMQAMGHILAKQTILAKPVLATGIGLIGAQFNRRTDTETCFDLFHADSIVNRAGSDKDIGHNTAADSKGEFAAVRLLPNQDFATGIDTVCQALGWTSAQVFGVGSINGARFENGQVLDSLPTEFLINDAIAQAGSATGAGGGGPEIVIVGIDGENILSGRLSRGENAVLVTAELVLSRLAD